MKEKLGDFIRELVLVIVLIIFTLIIGPKLEKYIDLREDKIALNGNDKANQVTSFISGEERLDLDIQSRSGILIRLEDGMILYSKLATDKMYPASLTKMMTSIIIIENLADLNKEIEISSDVYNELFLNNASMAGFTAGEVVKAKDLLYGILLPSGAEATVMLAKEVAETEEAFVNLMNQKAMELGMLDTQFANVTGLHNDNHYTTAHDLALLLNYSLKNELFKEIFTTKEYHTSPTTVHTEGLTFYSTIMESGEELAFENGELLGSKTGYTDLAGLCLASYAIVDGKDYMVVTLGAPGNHYTEQFNVQDALKIYKSIN